MNLLVASHCHMLTRGPPKFVTVNTCITCCLIRFSIGLSDVSSFAQPTK